RIECGDRQPGCTVLPFDNRLRITNVIALEADEPQPVIGNMPVMYSQFRTDKAAVMQPSVGPDRISDRLMHPIVQRVVNDSIRTFGEMRDDFRDYTAGC